ncbi:type I-E CRISPR-associated protein Cas7/Cse4/CasC [Saccharopolyspora gregorii]|uniref:type I-E CRISPR-associated protein Cas7/Cse4/CasC n=1 Tax=Saccharopolyspora gregorii TaxID=33914 RepID=UPI0021ACE1CC|nr:type I-E CRISPR-associated protein Cas7/Cse4/CasC [Saccharopolyspora gregorii]
MIVTSARTYIDLHVLHTVPPANLNRDDNGDPKEAFFGGVRRSRVSSQAWKRATRAFFAERNPDGDRATRTKKIAEQLTRRLAERASLDAETAARIATSALQPLNIKPGKKAGETAYLLFFGHAQLDAVIDLFLDDVAELCELGDEDLAARLKDLPVQETLNQGHPLDVGLFGRMVADIPALNVDAATQVAHALSTHAVELEMDYYTAVDDEGDSTGAGMIGTVGFNSATLYRYATVGLHQLETNLADPAAARDGIRLFTEAFARSMPTGKENSFAHHTHPTLVAVVIRRDQPVNLVSAFESPVASTSGIAAASARRLAEEHSRSVAQWGDTPLFTGVCHTLDPDSPEAGVVGKAFGDNHTFAELLDAMHTHLPAVQEVA